MARCQFGDDLAAYGVADQRRSLQPELIHPGREGPGEAGYVEDARGAIAQPEAGQVGHEDPAVEGQPFGGRDHVAARDHEPVHQDYAWPSRRRFPEDAGVHPEAARRRPYRFRFLALPHGTSLLTPFGPRAHGYHKRTVPCRTSENG